MKSKRILAVLILVLSALALTMLVGCGEKPDPNEGRVKVVFNLEGAEYRNTPEPIVYYYSFKAGTQNLIKEPSRFSGKELEKANCNFKGWFRTRTEEDGKVTYADKWDFEKDTVGDEGVTLYACWRQYTFDPGYIDDDGNFVSLDFPMYVMDDDERSAVFSVSKFADNFRVRYDASGEVYTFTGVLKDENGDPWDNGFVHPRGDEDLSVKVVAEFIKGDYTLVSTAAQLAAVTSPRTNIYLTDDIDFGGAAYKGIPGYRGIFEGNGHSVKNFTLGYSISRNDLQSDDDLDGNFLLCLSLFGRASGARILNVKFENATIDVNADNGAIRYIYVSPLFTKMTDCTVKNVAFSGTFVCSKLADGFDKQNRFTSVSDRVYYIQTGENGMEEITLNIDDKTGEYQPAADA